MSVIFESDKFSIPHLQLRYNGIDLEITLIGSAKKKDSLSKLLDDAQKIAKTLGIPQLEIDSELIKILNWKGCDELFSSLTPHVQKIVRICHDKPHNHPDFAVPSDKVNNFIRSNVGWNIQLSNDELEKIREQIKCELKLSHTE